MIGFGRKLTPHEQEVCDEYEAALDTVPGCRNYDRISVHNAFPHIKMAWDKTVEVHNATRKYMEITDRLLGSLDNNEGNIE